MKKKFPRFLLHIQDNDKCKYIYVGSLNIPDFEGPFLSMP